MARLSCRFATRAIACPPWRSDGQCQASSRHVESLLAVGRQNAQVPRRGAQSPRDAFLQQEEGRRPFDELSAPVPPTHGSGAATANRRTEDGLFLRYLARSAADRGNLTIHRLVP